MKEGDLELLNEIAKFEDSHDMEKEYDLPPIVIPLSTSLPQLI